MKQPRQLKSTDVPKLRKWLLKKQKGKCLICGKEPKTPCLDHSHTKRVKGSGLVRGVVCSPCNVFLAKAENNCVRYGIKIVDLPYILRKVAKYLEREHLPYLHPSEAPKPKILSKRSFNKIEKLYTETYPLRKPLEFPKSKKLTKKLELIYGEFKIKPEFLKRK